jgi:spore cortex formation protein SpoVR/YcgB (stage V sporulation)
MNDHKKKSLKKKVRRIEDEFGLDKTVEDIVDGILNIFENDADSEETAASIFQSDESDDDDDDSEEGDFGEGDFGGGGSSDDW